MWVVPGAVTHPSAVHPKHTELFGGSAAAQLQLKLRADAPRSHTCGRETPGGFFNVHIQVKHLLPSSHTHASTKKDIKTRWRQKVKVAG